MNFLISGKRIRTLVLATLIIFIITLLSYSLSFVDLDFSFYRLPVAVSESEVENAEKIIGATNDVSMDGINSVTDSDAFDIERYFSVSDFDGEMKYLYIEYMPSGFAVYDRIGEYVYETSELGGGPFDEFSEDSAVYYGGPSEYYVKKGNEFVHTVTNQRIGAECGAAISDGLEAIRAQYVSGQATSMSLNAVTAQSNDKMFFLGQDIADDELSSNASIYFVAKSLGLSMAYEPKNTLQLWVNPDPSAQLKGFIDTICGKNQFGSCGLVALSSILMYYDNLYIAETVKGRSNWHLMYDYEIKTVNDTIGAYLSPYFSYYRGNLSQVPNSYLTSEFLHQELIYQQFPQFRGMTTDELYEYIDYEKKYPFATFKEDRESAYRKYCDAYGVVKYSYNSNNGTYLLPEKLVKGNPILVRLAPGYPESVQGSNNGHVAVAYAFNGTHPLWYTVTSVVCDYGWQGRATSDKNYGAVTVNASFIVSNECIKVFKY